MSNAQLIDTIFVKNDIESVSTSTLIQLLREADDAFFNDTGVESPLTDDQYDTIKTYAQRMAPADVYFTGVGSGVRGGKVTLPYSMGSLDQVYSGDYAKWVQANHLMAETMVVSDKLDGASVLIVYNTEGNLQIAFSRGDGIEGADITRHVKRLHGVPLRVNNTTGGSVAIRAENIIPPSTFAVIMSTKDKVKQLKREYKNPRNMVSGLMNASDTHPDFIYQAIDTVAYTIVGSKSSKQDQLNTLTAYGFNVVRHRQLPASSLTDETLTEYLVDTRRTSTYELDGIVIDVDSAKTRNALDHGELNPPYAVKFKVADASNIADTTVIEVEWNVSKDGYWKPRVRFEPVDLVGVTIQHATGFNAKFIVDNNIGPGSVIKITRSGDVIPYIVGVVTPTVPQLPPGDSVWTSTHVDLVCTNVHENETVMFERLLSFFESLDAPYLGEGNLRQMFDMQFDTPEKIINLCQEDIACLVGSPSIGSKIYAGLTAKLTNIPLYVLMGAHHSLGRGVGVRKMKKLWEHFQGDMSKCADPSCIVSVEGFDTKTASKIAAGYPEFQTFLTAVANRITIAPFVAKPTGKFTGTSVVFTGFRSKDLEKAIEAKGGTIGSGVSSKTTYLVVADPSSTSGKAQKARDLGVQVIGVDQLKEMLNE